MSLRLQVAAAGLAAWLICIPRWYFFSPFLFGYFCTVIVFYLLETALEELEEERKKNVRARKCLIDIWAPLKENLRSRIHLHFQSSDHKICRWTKRFGSTFFHLQAPCRCLLPLKRQKNRELFLFPCCLQCNARHDSTNIDWNRVISVLCFFSSHAITCTFRLSWGDASFQWPFNPKFPE